MVAQMRVTEILPWLQEVVADPNPSAAPQSSTSLSGVFPAKLTEITSLSEWWGNVREFLATKGLEFGLHLVEALIIFVIGRWVTRALTRLIERIANQAEMDQTLVRFICHLVYATMLSFVVLSA